MPKDQRNPKRRKRTQKVKSAVNRNGKPKRPPNAWILYRADAWQRIHEDLEGDNTTDQCEVSRVISYSWKALSCEEKLEWQRKAEVAKAEHALANPGYRYQPERRMDSKRRRKRSESLDDDEYDEEGESRTRKVHRTVNDSPAARPVEGPSRLPVKRQSPPSSPQSSLRRDKHTRGMDDDWIFDPSIDHQHESLQGDGVDYTPGDTVKDASERSPSPQYPRLFLDSDSESSTSTLFISQPNLTTPSQ